MRIRNIQRQFGNKTTVDDPWPCYVRFMSRRKQVYGAFGAILVFLLVSPYAGAQESRAPDTFAPVVQTFPLADTKDLDESGVKTDAVEYKGRKAVRVAVAGANEGLAFLRGTEFEDETIEADVALTVTTPAGVRNPGFIGVAFRARPDRSALRHVLHSPQEFRRGGSGHAESFGSICGQAGLRLVQASESVAVSHAKRQPIENGGEADGTWE
jgi:hypothetical protein